MAKATIVIPVYNKEKYLRETLMSVDKQTEDDLEVIIVDDASSDHGMDIIYDFANSTKKQTKIIKNDMNQGVAYSRNIGVEEAKSDYISFLDADDILDKGFMEIMLSKAKRYPFIDFVNGVQIPFNMKYGYLDDGKIEGYYEEKVIVPALDQDYISRSNVACTGRMYKKTSIQNLKFVESAFEDYEFFLSTMAANLTLLYTKAAKYYYRVIPEGKYQTSVSNLSKCIDHFDIYDRVEEKFPQMILPVHEALRNRQASICIGHLQLLIPVIEQMNISDGIDFYNNYLQYLRVRYNLDEITILELLKDAGDLSTDSEILKQSIKRIAMRYQ